MRFSLSLLKYFLLGLSGFSLALLVFTVLGVLGPTYLLISAFSSLSSLGTFLLLIWLVVLIDKSLVFSERRKQKRAEILGQQAISNLYYKKQNTQLSIITGLSLAVLGVLIAGKYIFDLPIRLEAIWLMISAIAVLYIRKMIIEYRILKGFYGNNRYEARELIEFIEQNSEGWNLPGGGSSKKAFPESVLEDEPTGDDMTGETA
jgi:hypothetical protein